MVDTVGNDEWQGRTGATWADEWRRTDRSFALLTERLLQRSREFAFTGALDVGCGAGELTLALARGRPRVQVVGVDIAPALIEVARERGANLNNASFECADAASWLPLPDFRPDLLVSRHGLMFFAEPEPAFAHLASLCAPGAGLMFSCFRERSENPFFTEVARLSPHPSPAPAPDAPGPFALADRGRLEWLLGTAGWSEVAFEPFDFAMIVGAGSDPVSDAVEYCTRIGPAGRIMTELRPEERERFIERVRALATRNMQERIVSLRAAAWIVTARKR
jgi:SAM-dependent methyltransferase